MTAKRRRNRYAKRDRAHYLLRRILTFMAENSEWEIRFEPISDKLSLRKVHGHATTIIGFVDDEHQRIYVDHRQEIIAIVVHEFLHVLYEDLHEKKILRLEKLVMKHMTGRQAETLLRAVSNLLRPNPAAE